MSTKKGNRLTREILGYIGISGVISTFFYGFLLFMTQVIVELYCEKNNILMSYAQYEETIYWLRRVSFVATIIIFLFLCFFLTGQKLLYIKQLISGVEALQEKDMNFEVPVEGDDELAMLAESINYLAKSQRELKEKEEALKTEKDAFIRSLSHDIRTPLTSVIAMSEYMEQKESMTQEEVKDYISLVKNKSAQMKILTDRLLNEGQRNPVYVENGKLLFEQLIEEWQELLEEKFDCRVELENCSHFSCEFDIAELRRIFDNLASNVEKYADASKQVMVEIFTEAAFVVIRQSNYIEAVFADRQMNSVGEKTWKEVESYGIGLQSIERLAKIYNGTMEVEKNDSRFVITIRLGL